MSDELLEDLKADWRYQQVPIEKLRRRLQRIRWQTRVVMVIETMMTLLGLIVGVHFAVVAWQRRDLLFALSALSLLLVCVPLAIEVYRTRRRSLHWADRTPEGTLRYALTRLHLTRQILLMQYCQGVALLLLVAVVWASAHLGYIAHDRSLGALLGIWIAAAFATLLWSRWRMRRVDTEYATCQKLLDSFMDAATDE